MPAKKKDTTRNPKIDFLAPDRVAVRKRMAEKEVHRAVKGKNSPASIQKQIDKLVKEKEALAKKRVARSKSDAAKKAAKKKSK